MDIVFLVFSAFIILILLLIGLRKLLSFSSTVLIIGSMGAILGLIMGALLSFPLSRLSGVYGEGLPLIVTLALIIGTAGLLLAKKEQIVRTVNYFIPKKNITGNEIIIDTSSLIDGRLADVAKTGFISGSILVPRYILDELQHIADSSEPERRAKGRRGLEMLERLKGIVGIRVDILDAAKAKDKVDASLVALAKEKGAYLLTTDYNLNRVATIEGVRVLNINEMANAIRPVFLPGEEIKVSVVQEGKEKHQGVGYLPDGTMIVVEGGDKLIGQEVEAGVTRVLQTVAGKMVFVKPKK